MRQADRYSRNFNGTLDDFVTREHTLRCNEDAAADWLIGELTAFHASTGFYRTSS